MLLRTEAGVIGLFVAFTLAGCTTNGIVVAQRVPDPPAPFSPGSPSNDSEALQRLLREAEQSCAQQSSYICRLRRREPGAGKPKAEEIMIFKCRAKPFSVHFKWLGDEGKGREVVFVAGKDDQKLHILTAAHDIPFTPAGRQISLPIDSLLVKAASKYPITEAGVCRIVARFRRLLDDHQRGLPGLSIRYLGPTPRPEYGVPLEMVELTLPPGREPEAPHGGSRLLGFDPQSKWPVFSTTFDPNGNEIDYYCFDRFQFNVLLDDDDFSTERLWPAKTSKP
jgi:hypothetical protein